MCFNGTFRRLCSVLLQHPIAKQVVWVHQGVYGVKTKAAPKTLCRKHSLKGPKRILNTSCNDECLASTWLSRNPGGKERHTAFPLGILFCFSGFWVHFQHGAARKVLARCYQAKKKLRPLFRKSRPSGASDFGPDRCLPPSHALSAQTPRGPGQHRVVERRKPKFMWKLH